MKEIEGSSMKVTQIELPFGILLQPLFLHGLLLLNYYGVTQIFNSNDQNNQQFKRALTTIAPPNRTIRRSLILQLKFTTIFSK